MPSYSLNIFFGISTVIGVVLTIYFYLRSKALYRERFRYSWADVTQGLSTILSELEKESFKPDIILTISGPGGIVANLAMTMIDEYLPFYQAMIEDPSKPWAASPHGHTIVKSTRWKIHIPDSILDEEKERNILIVDDTCVTGTTVGGIVDYLTRQGFKSIKWGCLLRVKPVEGLPHKPDIYYFENPTSEFYYPWGKGK